MSHEFFEYIQVIEQFTINNNGYYVDPNILNIVQALSKRYVTSVNSYDVFPDLFQQAYNFVLVDQNFYNQYNDTVIIPGMDPLFVRIANDGNYVVEQLMQQYYSQLFTFDEPILQYTVMDFQDTFLILSHDDFPHTTDVDP